MGEAETRAGLDLEVIESRANAATRGPWEIYPIEVQLSDAGREKGYPVDLLKKYAFTVNTVWHHGQSHAPVSIIGLSVSPYRQPTHLPCITEADAEFIAHARQDVPNLLAEVRRLRAVADAARIAFTQITEIGHQEPTWAPGWFQERFYEMDGIATGALATLNQDTPPEAAERAK